MNALFKARPAYANGKAGARTPLLDFLAGDHADDVARIWDAPHQDFFVMPTARRHAAGMILAGLAADPPETAKRLRLLVERERDACVARAIAGGDAPGFMRALAKMGEVLWSRRDYAQFLALFAEPNANEALRHMAQITPDRFAPLGVLPAALRTPKILAAVPHGQAATDLAIALELAIRIRGADAGPAIAARWARAKDAKALFDKAAADLEPDAFAGLITPAPDLPPPFGAVRTRKALEAVALEFRNCLRDYTAELAQGRMAVYVWRAREKAAVALTLDAAGWRLAEALGENNVDLEEQTLREIVAVLEDVNVRTGPPVISLVGRLQAYGAGREAYSNREPGFAGELEMGDLWN